MAVQPKLGIVSVFTWLAESGPQGWEFREGRTINYATPEVRAINREYIREQRAKGGRGGFGGINRVAAYRAPIKVYDPSQRMAGRSLMGTVGGSRMARTSTSGSSVHVSTPQKSSVGPSVRANYTLGAPSKAFWAKYGRWGSQGPRSSEGWKATLTQAPEPKSTTGPTQLIDKELIQTRETRTKNWQKPFQLLMKATTQSKLSPNLSYMFKSQGKQVGPVRRITRKLF